MRQYPTQHAKATAQGIHCGSPRGDGTAAAGSMVIPVAEIAESATRVLLQAGAQRELDGLRRAIGTLPNRARARGPRQSCRAPFRRKGRASGEHLEQHAAKRPDVGALVDRLAARLLRTHVGGGAENDARAVSIARRSCVDAADAVEPPLSICDRFGEPEVEHLDRAVRVILMFAGLRSRWTMPFSCAASSASAIWRAIASASASGSGAARDPVGQRLALDELQHQRRAPVGSSTP